MTDIEKSMLTWFDHVEKRSERLLTKRIYKADVSNNAGRYAIIKEISKSTKIA